ncbi:hypothetical protein M885DRAFT_508216 [Pelagophyceae sp. CCMP2097]|nr:hypothetical protein M885DRAFT_508216 [Pelagophyceae sp. CCMP2097]
MVPASKTVRSACDALQNGQSWLPLLNFRDVDASAGPLAYLDAYDRAACEAVSRGWRDEAKAPQLWVEFTAPRRLKRTDAPLLSLFANDCAISLRAIDAGLAHVTDAVLALVALNCPHLRRLDVCNARTVTDAAIAIVASKCSDLSVVNVSGCVGLTDAAVKALCALPLLSLATGHCRNITDAALSAVADGCARTLRRLDVRGCGRVGDDSMRRVAAECSRLEFLCVADCTKLTDASITAFARCAHLAHVDVGWLPQLTDFAVVALAACPLVFFEGGCCRRLSDASIFALANCRSLKHIGLDGCGVTDAGVHALCTRRCAGDSAGDARPALASLRLGGCGLSDAALLNLAAGQRGLVSLDVSGVAGLTCGALDALRRGCAGLVDFDAAHCAAHCPLPEAPARRGSCDSV